ncbi:heme-binding protein [Mycobacterium sp. DL592]|uniref:heme-binding protein n=1 Tax=Mycobacterium sp. DL592 TaxID=2675524 RepID=UPI001420CB3B|nr:heme-binding protein [Mycobacterium sp. DL592]
MSSLTYSVGRTVAVGLGAGAVLLAAAGPAAADPPPNCTSADLAGVMSGVSFALSGYLFTHPDVNDFFTGLKDLPMDQKRAEAKAYLDANPQVKAEVQGIRQPSVDFHNRCDVPVPVDIAGQ